MRLVALVRDETILAHGKDETERHESCKCVDVGGSKEYAAYQRLVTERQIAQQRIWTDEESGGWGPWYWRRRIAERAFAVVRVRG